MESGTVGVLEAFFHFSSGTAVLVPCRNNGFP